MKHTILIVAAAASMALAAPQAFAQAKNFEGFSVGLNYNSAKSSSTILATSGTFAGQEFSGDGPGQFGSLQAQYSFALGDKFVMGVGATAALGSYSLGNIFTTTNVESSQKQQYSVDFLPGYALSESTLAYGRVSYVDAIANSTTSTNSTDKNTNGIGYGLGLRVMATKNVFWQAEYSKTNYSDVVTAFSTSKYSSSVLSLGVGYKF